jgi:N-acetylglucosamine kinase-like BadF-type ATPase
MTKYFVGGDLGGTKTHILIADETGQAIGFGESGPGNHENVGYDGLSHAVKMAFDEALASAGISAAQVAGVGFGIGGFDWPFERADHLRALSVLGLSAPIDIVNDATLGLLAGSAESWGVAVVSGTGCNCRGWDRGRQHEGRVTGYGIRMGEGAGATELMFRATQMVAYEWSQRGPATALTPAFIEFTGAKNLDDLIEGLTFGRYSVDAPAAPLVFQVASAGDQVALALAHWAGVELGEMANAVIRQLGFAALAFDVVLIGSMFRNGELLISPMRETILSLAPQARLVRFEAPPVIGALLLGMEVAQINPTQQVRQALVESVSAHRQLLAELEN